MNRHFSGIKIIALLMCFMLVLSGTAGALTVTAADKTSSGGDETFFPNEVIVMFESDAVNDSSMSLKSARRLANVAPDYGSMSEAVGEEDKAAEDAKAKWIF